MLDQPNPADLLTLPDTVVDLDELAPTVAEVNLGHLRHNARVLQEYAGGAELLGVVKADAYGHGAVEVAGALRAEGVRRFAVATLPEAIRLRRAGFTERVLVFGAPLPDYLPVYARYDLDLTVSSIAVAEQVFREARSGRRFRIHLKVDTGMGRIGVRPDEVEAAVRLLEGAPGVERAGLWTHFARADDEPDEASAGQLSSFTSIVERFGDSFEHIHAANSPAALRYPESHRPFPRALVRTGMALYGYTNMASLTEQAGLLPVMTVVSRVTHLKTVPPGTPISYSHSWRAPGLRRIATVNAGYADGYPRSATNKAEVAIGGRRYAQAGNVCMDMFMVDLGEPDGPGAEVQAGDEVILFGEGGPSAFDLAQWAGSIPYEICCRVAPRVPRRYLEGRLPRI